MMSIVNAVSKIRISFTVCSQLEAVDAVSDLRVALAANKVQMKDLQRFVAVSCMTRDVVDG